MSSKADEYNARQWAAGKIKPAHLTELAREWQRSNGLDVDGFLGPKTLASLDAVVDGKPGMPAKRCWPLANLQGRRPLVTSAYYTKNPSRADPLRPHRGVDIFFRFDPTIDPTDRVGDGGRDAKYWIPKGWMARASADGIVHSAVYVGPSRTGFRAWIDHGGGYHTGYFHLGSLIVSPGAMVKMGDPIGPISHDPSAWDARHLHFECYSGELGGYPRGSFDPDLWLAGASYLD